VTPENIVEFFANFRKRRDHGDPFYGVVPQERLHELLLNNLTVETLPKDFQKVLEKLAGDTPPRQWWEELRTHDVFLDLQAADEVFGKPILEVEKWEPATVEGRQAKIDALKALRELHDEVVKRLKYIPATFLSAHESGARRFYLAAEEIIEACYQQAITIGEVECGKDLGRLIAEAEKAAKT